MKKKVVVTGEFTNKKIKNLEERFLVVKPKDRDSLEKEILEAEVVLSRHTTIDKALINKSKNLKLISLATTGYDSIDIEECTKHNIQVCNSPQLDEEVGDIAIFHIINAMRKCNKANQQLRKGQWYDNESVGMEINHKNLLIVGYGRIGKTIARKARVLGVNLFATSPHLIEDDVKDDYIVKAVKFKVGIKLADIVVLAVPLTKKTFHMIDENTFHQMKNSSVLVNISRGEVVDSKALIKALNEGEINYASVDVFENEPLKENNEALFVKNLYLTPHIGSFTFATRDRMQQNAIENVFDYFEGKDVRFKINKI
ncbi:MAG: hypothetical protein OWP43_13075 [Sphaerochaetaceae bacterium]|nr:hypothetical protein [Sphaerochaetaceae bacterium]